MAAIRLTSRFVHRCFCYHVVNCHDDPAYPNRVVVDVCKADATNALGMAKGFEAGVSGYGEDVSFFNENAVGVSDYGSAGKYKSNHPDAAGHGRDVATLWRWIVDVESGTVVSSTRMCAEPSDFPCVNPNHVGLPYGYCYTRRVPKGDRAGEPHGYSIVRQSDEARFGHREGVDT